jgi:hypothetical protein
MMPDRIPAEMREARRWFVWRYELRDGRRTKVPYNPLAGRRASSIDPSTWTTFEQASAARGFDGLGFALGGGFAGVDLDRCRDPLAGGARPARGIARAYLRSTNGQVWGHPPRDAESKYLLVGLTRCGVCGSGMSVRSRSHGTRRAYYYVCTGYHLRGRHVCANRFELPMADTVLGEFRAGVATFFNPDALATCVAEGGRERAPRPDCDYVAHFDASGGRHDADDCNRSCGQGRTPQPAHRV